MNTIAMPYDGGGGYAVNPSIVFNASTGFRCSASFGEVVHVHTGPRLPPVRALDIARSSMGSPRAFIAPTAGFGPQTRTGQSVPARRHEGEGLCGRRNGPDAHRRGEAATPPCRASRDRRPRSPAGSVPSLAGGRSTGKGRSRGERVLRPRCPGGPRPGPCPAARRQPARGQRVSHRSSAGAVASGRVRPRARAERGRRPRADGPGRPSQRRQRTTDFPSPAPFIDQAALRRLSRPTRVGPQDAGVQNASTVATFHTDGW